MAIVTIDKQETLFLWSRYFLAKVRWVFFPWVTGGAKRTAVLLMASVFGGPVYSSVHWLDVCGPWISVLPCGAGSRDVRIQRSAPPSFEFWEDHREREMESVFRLYSGRKESSCNCWIHSFDHFLSFLPSFESTGLFEGILFLNGLILDSTLRSAEDDRSTTRFTKKGGKTFRLKDVTLNRFITG